MCSQSFSVSKCNINGMLKRKKKNVCQQQKRVHEETIKKQKIKKKYKCVPVSFLVTSCLNTFTLTHEEATDVRRCSALVPSAASGECPSWLFPPLDPLAGPGPSWPAHTKTQSMASIAINTLEEKTTRQWKLQSGPFWESGDVIIYWVGVTVVYYRVLRGCAFQPDFQPLPLRVAACCCCRVGAARSVFVSSVLTQSKWKWACAPQIALGSLLCWNCWSWISTDAASIAADCTQVQRVRM